jgi:3-oxoadipate enol-lactonase
MIRKVNSVASDLHVHVGGQGPTLVWGHGMMSSMAGEDGLLGLWDAAPADVRLVRYDARGHGKSPAGASARDFTWERQGADMLALATGPVVLGGWSMGCAAALHAALSAPQRVRGLVLMLPPLFWEARVAHAALYRRAADLGRRLGQRNMGRMVLLGQGTPLPPWLAQARPAAALPAAAGMASLNGAAMALMYDGAAQSDLPPARVLAQLAHLPALIVAWPGDDVHPLASAERLHGLLPGSTLRIVASDADLRATGERIAAFTAALA